MMVRYKNNYTDAVAFATVHNLRSIPLLAFLFACAAFLAWLILPDEVHGIAAWVGFALVTLLASGILIAFQLLFNTYWFAFNRDKNFLTDHTVELTEAAFVESTPLTRAECQWPGIFRVYRRLNRLFVFEGPGRAHCIPARAFPGRAEFEAFTNRAMESWRRAR